MKEKEKQTNVEENVADEKSNKLQIELDALREENEKLISENECLEKENQRLDKENKRLNDSAEKSESYLTQLVAMKNDFESYKRRMKLNTENAKNEGIQSVAEKLLPIADTFEIAMKSITDENTLKAFNMMYDSLKKAISEMGIEQIEVMGKDFDHMTMNALSKLDRGEENKDKVVEVYKNGYKMGDKVIRYAEVIVGA